MNDQLWVFGGEDLSDLQNDLWMYDLVNQYWVEITPASGSPTPEAREKSFATSANNMFYMCGGESSSEVLQDCWSFDPQNLAWTQLADLPQVRAGSHMHTLSSA